MDAQVLHQPNRLAAFISRLRSNETLFGVILAIIVGVIAGFGAVVFWQLIKWVSWLFFSGGATIFEPLGKYYVVLLPVIGGLLIGPIIYFLAREAKGDGIPDTIEAIAIKGGRIRWLVTPIKVLASSICIGSGGSVGREGPIVQIGASAGSTLGGFFHLSDEWLKTLALCGVAGGISATFNAPLAGIIFALEVIAGRFITPRFGYIVISSVAANVIARIFLFTEANPTSFVVPQYELVSYWEILPYALLGVIIAFVAAGFIRFFFKVEDIFARIRIPDYLKPALGGLIIGIIGLYYPQVFGVGYGEHYISGGAFVETAVVEQALAGNILPVTLAVVLILKIVATSITLGSGGSGGVFAPSLVVGSLLGGLFGSGVHTLFPENTAFSGAYALVGMGAFFAVVVRAPITTIIILFEITMNYSLILPLLTAVVIGTIIAHYFFKEGIYTASLLKKGIDIRQLEQTIPMKMVTVAEIMTRNFPSVPPTMPVTELVTKLKRSGHHGFPVVDEGGDLVGCVTLTDVESALVGGSHEELTVDNISTKSVMTAYPDQYIHDVLVKIGVDVGRIPVVDRDNPRKLVGVLRRHDIVSAYSKIVTGKRLRAPTQP